MFSHIVISCVAIHLYIHHRPPRFRHTVYNCTSIKVLASCKKTSCNTPKLGDKSECPVQVAAVRVTVLIHRRKSSHKVSSVLNISCDRQTVRRRSYRRQTHRYSQYYTTSRYTATWLLLLKLLFHPCNDIVYCRRNCCKSLFHRLL